MTTILLIGASGQIGSELARTLAPLGRIVIADRTRFDLARPQSLRAAVAAVAPDVIVNAAAYTAVDNAEKEPDLALAVNGAAPGELAAAAREAGALMVHYSTDYVFDGRKPGAYTEDDPPAPLSSYGRTKLAGEQAVQASGAHHLVFRTSWVYAAQGKNFLRTMLRLAAEREELRVVADQVGAPTWARVTAEATARALTQDLARLKENRFESGLFHMTAAGETSWHGFASAIVAQARERGAALECRTVTPITTAEYPLPAARPRNSRLAGAKLEERYGIRLPAWDESMRECLAAIFPG